MTVVPNVVVAQSSKELSQWVRSRRTHHPTVASLRPGGTRARADDIAHEMLVMLGKRTDMTVLKHRAEHVAAAWLKHGAATDVLILEAQQVTPRVRCEIACWLIGLGVTPWFIFGDSPPSGRRLRDAVGAAEKMAADWGVELLDEETLRAAFPDTAVRSRARLDAPVSGLPVLPRVDGMVFRTACRELLAPGDATKVDALFVAKVKEFRAAVETMPANRANYPKFVARIVREALEATRDTDELLLAARAAQVGLITEGWHIGLHTTALVAAGELRPRNGTVNTPAMWERISQYRDPDIGAIVALHLAGFTWDDISNLDVADVDTTTGEVAVAGVPVPLPGADYLRVLLTYRELLGANTPELFTNNRARDPRAKPTQIRKLLDDITDQTGLPVADTRQGKKPGDDTEWLARFGVTITNLRVGRPPKPA